MRAIGGGARSARAATGMRFARLLSHRAPLTNARVPASGQCGHPNGAWRMPARSSRAGPGLRTLAAVEDSGSVLLAAPSVAGMPLPSS